MKKIYVLGIITVVAFLLRAAVFYGYLMTDNRYIQVDTATYDMLAHQLAADNLYTNPDGSPTAYRLPGYPLFLALVYKLTNHNTLAALWIQIILASFIPLLIFLLTNVLFPGFYYTALAAALITAVHLGYVLYAGFMMTETLFVFLFLIFCILFFRVLFTHRKTAASTDPQKPWYKLDSDGRSLFLAGIVLGCASLVRPVGHYLVVVASILLLCTHRRLLSKLVLWGIFLTGWFIVVGGWLLRNWLIFGHVFFHTLPGGHFLYLSAARVVAAEQNISYHDARSQLRSLVEQREAFASQQQGYKLDQYQMCVVHEKLALEVFRRAPLLALKFWLQDIMRATLSLNSAELLYLESGRQEIAYFATGRSIKNWFMRYLQPATDKLWLKILIWVEIVFHFLLLLATCLFCLSALLGKWARNTHVFLVTAPFMVLFIFISLAGGYARMRLPMEFFMIILACTKISQLIEEKI